MASTRFDTQGNEFDIEVQRFLVNRWVTPIGEALRKELIDGIKAGVEIRGILDPHVLDDPENSESYGYPVYPRKQMLTRSFWVLNQDDLRGIHVYNEDFTGTPSLEIKMLDYAHFYNCQFDEGNLERSALTRSRFEKCSFQNSVLAASGGFYTYFKSCDFRNACFWQTSLIEATFVDCDLSECYFEDAQIIDPLVDHQTNFGTRINRRWKTRMITSEAIPDINKFIRLAYQRSELFEEADRYRYAERQAYRRFILLPRFRQSPSLRGLAEYLSDLLWAVTMGYGLKPFRILAVGPFIALLFSLIYLSEGVPITRSATPSSFFEYLYFSITSFATLGYGDLAFDATHPWLRIFSATEALLGAAWIAVFIAVLSRRLLR